MPKTIAYITPYLPEKDGIAYYSAKIISQAKLHGYRPEIVVKAGHAAAASGCYPLVTANPLGLPALFRFFLRSRAEIVHFQFALPYWAVSALVFIPLCWFIKSFTRKKIIITFHEVKREFDMLGFLAKLYYACLLAFVDRITVHTREAQKILYSITDPAKVSVISLGHFMDKSLKSTRQKNQILYFGFIHTDKGIDTLIEAVSRLSRHSKTPPRLIIAGDIRRRNTLFGFFQNRDLWYLRHLHSLVSSLGLQDRVRFLGRVSEARAESLFKSSSLIVLPYTNVEQSGVLFHAIGYKTPLVVSDIGGLSEVVSDPRLKFSPGDFNSLADRIRFVLDSKNLPAVGRFMDGLYAHYRFSAIFSRDYLRLYSS